MCVCSVTVSREIFPPSTFCTFFIGCNLTRFMWIFLYVYIDIYIYIYTNAAFFLQLDYLATSPQVSRKNRQHTGEKAHLGCDGKCVTFDGTGRIKGTDPSIGQVLWYKYSCYKLPTTLHKNGKTRTEHPIRRLAPYPAEKDTTSRA